MTVSQKAEAPVGRSSRLERWLRRLLFPAGQARAIRPAAYPFLDHAAAYGGFHWLNHPGPLSEDELRVLSFLSVGM